MENTPIRVIKGTMQPHEPFWNIIDAASSESGETEIQFFGPISEYSWWGDELTPKKFREDLYAKGKGGPVRIKVNSTGGEVIAANVIRSIIKDYPGSKIADIVGIAASAATIVVTAADKVVMRDGSLFMIHNPTVVAWGDAKEMRDVAEILDKIKDGILTTYMQKTGMDKEELSKLMDDETWLTAQEAVQMKFADEIIDSAKNNNLLNTVPQNMRSGFLNCLAEIHNAPESLIEAVKDGEAIETNVPVPETSSESEPVANEREVTKLRNYLSVFGHKE